MNGPVTLEGRYKTEYYLNVTSPIGKVEGSGWYMKGSIASFSVDRSSVPAEGLLGLLGLKRSFVQWVGSNDFLGAPVEPQGSVMMNRPVTIEAIWQDDYASLIPNVAILLFVIAALGVVVAFAARSRRQHAALRR